MPRNALMELLQSASNSAASNVSAPVDGIAWLLRKAGVPVPANPLMGSDWMAQQGLTKPVQQGAAQVAGDTFGMAAPFAAAAKAPQIANALLQVERNALAPSTLGAMGQRGATVWHGSPHKFDAFDSSKIGTGEGAQAYGHGLYLAESPEVGGQYARMNLTGPANVAHVAGRDGGDAMAALKRVYPGMPSQWYESAIRKSADAGNLYKVDLPDPVIARMLDWDKPLSQQAPVSPMLDALQEAPELPAGFGRAIAAARSRKHFDGNDLFAELVKVMPNAQASEVMRRAGFPGIRYLDGGSRGAGVGSSNYVVFPGEENALKILERNGQQLKR